MLGTDQVQAMGSVAQQCDLVFKHAHLRQTFKGVAEVVKLQKGDKGEEEKM